MMLVTLFALTVVAALLTGAYRPAFLVRHRRAFSTVSMFLFLCVATLFVAGCGVPAWLQDANNIIGLVGTSITAIGAFIAGLTGNAALAAGLAEVNAWIVKVEQGITDLETLIAQYNSSQDASTLAKIEAALADVETNLAQDFSNLGLPAGVLSTIAGIAGLALSQIQAWGSLLPAAKATPMERFTVITPFDKAQYKAMVNKILATPTGDAEVDAALAKVHKL